MFILTETGNSINIKYITSIRCRYNSDKGEDIPYLVTAYGTHKSEQYQIKRFGTRQEAIDYIDTLTEEINNEQNETSSDDYGNKNQC